MSFELPKLKYEMNALEPHISKETLEFHYGKHHNAYVTKLNDMLPGSGLEGKSLEDIIKKAEGGLFNQAAQHYNHSFYWECLGPNKGGEPSGKVKDAIDKAFGNFSTFREKFTASATGNFGSGWTGWLKTVIRLKS